MISTFRSSAGLAATTATTAAGAGVIQATSGSSSSITGSSSFVAFLLGAVAGYLFRQATAAASTTGTDVGKKQNGADSAPKEDASDPTKDKEATVEKSAAEGILIVEGEDDAAAAKVPAVDASKSFSIRLAVQRFRQGQLTVYEGAGDKEGSPRTARQGGLLVYISFSNTATEAMLYTAALTVLNLPVMTLGRWGDGSKPCSILEAAVKLRKAKKEEAGSAQSKLTGDERELDEGVAVMIVPQANLICKVKRNGKSIQYHGQIGPTKGAPLYQGFVRMVQLLLLECQYQQEDAEKEDETARLVSATLDRLRGKTKKPKEPLSSSWDDAGFPLGGEEFSPRLPAPSSSFVSLIPGTFGRIQALEFQSDMGPFCHVVNL